MKDGVRYAQYTATGRKTRTDLELLAIAEFTRLFETDEFTMSPVGNAEPDVIFGATGEVYLWKQTFFATVKQPHQNA